MTITKNEFSPAVRQKDPERGTGYAIEKSYYASVDASINSVATVPNVFAYNVEARITAEVKPQFIASSPTRPAVDTVSIKRINPDSAYAGINSLIVNYVENKPVVFEIKFQPNPDAKEQTIRRSHKDREGNTHFFGQGGTKPTQDQLPEVQKDFLKKHAEDINALVDKVASSARNELVTEIIAEAKTDLRFGDTIICSTKGPSLPIQPTNTVEAGKEQAVITPQLQQVRT